MSCNGYNINRFLLVLRYITALPLKAPTVMALFLYISQHCLLLWRALFPHSRLNSNQLCLRGQIFFCFSF